LARPVRDLRVVRGQTRSRLRREKRLKKWPRQWKIDLIEAHNPTWDDLYER
jgi:putative endonuclease